jgi:DNA-binding NarL/FixJ family response regulator
MPELDGEATFVALQKRWPDVKVLFLTGLCDDARKEALRSRGARGVMIKPCSSDLLRRAVRTELHGILVRGT